MAPPASALTTGPDDLLPTLLADFDPAAAFDDVLELLSVAGAGGRLVAPPASVLTTGAGASGAGAGAGGALVAPPAPVWMTGAGANGADTGAGAGGTLVAPLASALTSGVVAGAGAGGRVVAPPPAALAAWMLLRAATFACSAAICASRSSVAESADGRLGALPATALRIGTTEIDDLLPTLLTAVDRAAAFGDVLESLSTAGSPVADVVAQAEGALLR